MATAAYRRPPPPPHQAFYMGSANASTSVLPTKSRTFAPMPTPPTASGSGTAARLPFAHANNASSTSYRVERDRRNGQDCEVIVIEDSPEVSSQPPVAKRRKQDANGYQSAHDNPYAGYNYKSRQPPPPPAAVSAVVGGKRKHGEVSARQVYEPPAQAAKKAKHAVKAEPVPQPCDDKEGHYIPRKDETLGGGRYKIRHLLGQGTFGKVVECEDLDQPGTAVAVKVIRAVQKYRDASKVEVKVLRRLRQADPSNTHNCIHMLDCFDDRNHICIVTELLSVSVFDFLKSNNYAPFPELHIWRIARQLLDSVAFLHGLGLIHTDLKPENILLVSQNSYAGCRKNQTKAQRILENADIRLIDFGSATFQDDYHASVVSTRHYRAPEIILGLGWSYPCDVWSIGCILVELYTGEALFQTHENLEHLAMMANVCKKIPPRLARRAAPLRPEWFTSKKLLAWPQSTTNRQSRKFVGMVKDLEDIVPSTSLFGVRFQDLLKRLLNWEEDERITPKEAYRHNLFMMDQRDLDGWAA